MKKKIISILLASMCFFGWFGWVFAADQVDDLPRIEVSGHAPVKEVDITQEPSTTTVVPSSTDATNSVSPYPVWVSSPYGVAGGWRVNSSMLQVGGGDNSANGSTNVTFRENFIKNIQVYILGLLGIVTVSVFLYIGFMLFTAQGREEEFKKAWVALVYAVIGLAVIPLAYIAVKIVTGFTFY